MGAPLPPAKAEWRVGLASTRLSSVDPWLAVKSTHRPAYDAARAAFIARQPMGRLGTPEEIADLAVYLAGATYTSGQAYAIDGGWTI